MYKPLVAILFTLSTSFTKELPMVDSSHKITPMRYECSGEVSFKLEVIDLEYSLANLIRTEQPLRILAYFSDGETISFLSEKSDILINFTKLDYDEDGNGTVSGRADLGAGFKNITCQTFDY